MVWRPHSLAWLRRHLQDAPHNNWRQSATSSGNGRSDEMARPNTAGGTALTGPKWSSIRKGSKTPVPPPSGLRTMKPAPSRVFFDATSAVTGRLAVTPAAATAAAPPAAGAAAEVVNAEAAMASDLQTRWWMRPVGFARKITRTAR